MNAIAGRIPQAEGEQTPGPGLGASDEEHGLGAELLRAQARLRPLNLAFEQSAEGIMICDSRARIQTVNAMFETLTGYSEAEVLGKTPAILHSGRQSAAFYADMWRSINATGGWRGELYNRRKSGEVCAERLSIRAVYDDSQNVTHYIGMFSDLTESKAAEASAKHTAEYDLLTQLPNRALLVLRLRELMLARHSGEKIAVLYVDLDRFSEINGTMGRDAGDLLLQTVAHRLSTAVRHSDIVARASADEFIVLAPALLETSDATEIAAGVFDAIRAPVGLKGQDVVVSASIGIAISPHDGTDPEELIRNAAAAMRQAKREQSNPCQLYRREMSDLAAERLQTEIALRLAIERHELVLHYQPQIDLSSGRIIGAEALVRWNKPGEGLLPPSRFIPIAEESGLILAVDEWVISEAIRQIKAWNTQGIAPVTVAVNISERQFRQPDFAESIARAIRVNGVDPARLELELTESIAVRDTDVTMETLRRLHHLGVRLSLDDFGTGYSSMSYLCKFPIDKIKIDQSFIREMTRQPESSRIVRGVIALAKSFTMRVIAEGVETPQQLALLRAAQCDEFQGYLASAALPAEEFERFLLTWKSLP